MEEPEMVWNSLVSSNFFQALGTAPALGRTFTPAEVARGDRVLVVSRHLWQRAFAGSADAIGRTVNVDGLAYKLIGVMPADFEFPARFIRFVQLEECNRQGKSRPQSQIGIRLESGSKFAGGDIVLILPQGIVPFAQVRFRRIRRALREC